MGTYTVVLILVVMVFILNLTNYEVDGKQSMSKEEDLELDKQLTILNKPPIKTIHSSWGDIYDCIDFYKQPAFDHPSLRNHKFQMKPNSELKSGSGETSIFRTHVEKCLQGTIPIRRTQKEDLIRAKYLSLSTEPMYASPHEKFAGILYKNEGETLFGASAKMSIWKPSVGLDQYSLAEISLRSGWDNQYNRIHVGWTVNPLLYNNDTAVRIFLYWTSDNGNHTGCFNTLCPGFVQVNPEITPDHPLSTTSIYEGIVYELKYHVYLSPSEKKWWFVIENATIGYWPAEILPRFGDIGVERIYWGGHSMDNEMGFVPEMGSGHLPDENFGHAASFTQIQYDNASGNLLDVSDNKLTEIIGCKKNYGMDSYGYLDEQNRRHSIQYGGPGGVC
ncbi:hypothetical protein MKW98_020770 [Papaver atlanticum]|uniref:Neprosin PEP catalytic domain-containing protein n=1 Tax=Papaver atlanticum TaxID=357466 RepID=A0AAD4TIA4_9MAGN|nr:hypothetical protein MKW98_020770 [Papaver atlanticum]